MKFSMEIVEYNYDNRMQYSDFIRKYNKSNCLNSLNVQTFSKGKKIFLMIDKGFIKKYKIIGYSIIYEDLHVICLANDISQKYDGDNNTIFIADFMIDYLYRNQENGKFLAKYILDEVYKDKDIILQPDGDGNWFWKKFGFVNDNISKQVTWILKRNKCINIVRGDDLG